MRAISKNRSPELEQRIQELVKPGMVFGEPFREGKLTVIPVSRVNASPTRLIARPIGAILVSPQGVELRRFAHPAARVLTLAMLAAIIFWIGMLLNPPWKPEASLLGQVRELVNSMRGQEPGSD